MSRVDPDGPSLTGLAGRLTEQTRRLAKLEVRLLRAEVAHGARRAALPLAMLLTAMVLGLVMLGTGVATVVLALDLVMPIWAATLVVCVAAGLVAVPVGVIGALWLKRVPRSTAERIEDDVRWSAPR